MKRKTKKLTLQELKDLQESMNWTQFAYVSENQKGFQLVNPAKASLTFQRMTVLPMAGGVCFNRGRDYLSVYSVVRVIYHYNEPFSIWDLITFVCDNQCGNQKRYTFNAYHM